jgi:hypothetical protein
MKTWQLILSILLFQATWLSAAFGYEYISGVGVIGLIFALKFSQANFIQIILAGGLALGLGIIMDSGLYGVGVYEFPDTDILYYFNIPIWLLTMWVAFSITLFSSFYWALAKPVVFIIICALLGPVSYLAGREIGIIQFQNISLFIMVFSWTVWAAVFLLVWHRCIKKMSV